MATTCVSVLQVIQLLYLFPMPFFLGLFSPGGLQRCLRGGAFGLTVGLAGAIFTSWDRIKDMLGA